MNDALTQAAEVRAGHLGAADAVRQALESVRRVDPEINCFNHLLDEQATTEGADTDATIAAGKDSGPLAGVPFAVKALFDVKGVTTTAGAMVWADRPPASRDATAVARLRDAGAILLGTLNMDEFAFGFTTENDHYGTSRNPHDPDRVAGGSSGGSAAAVAAGLVPIALGSDTNGSVRVPAALCGVYGMKPTYGAVPRTGVSALAWSFDHVGCFARSAGDIAAAMDLLRGDDGEDPLSADVEPGNTATTLDHGCEGLRIAVAGGYFAQGGLPEVFSAVAKVAECLGAGEQLLVPEVDRAYAASLMITSAEGATLHAPDIRRDISRFDSKMRDRWIAASLIPAGWANDAQRFRRWYRDALSEAMADIDLLITPTTPFPAPLIGQAKIEIDGLEVVAKPALGRFTAPISFVGWPALSVPLTGQGLPMGVQLVAKPHREDLLLRAARQLEKAGIAGCPTPVIS